MRHSKRSDPAPRGFLRTTRRPRRSLALVLLAAILLVATLPPAAMAGPEPASLLATAYNTQRKLARSADGFLYASVTVNESGVPRVRVVETADGRTWSLLPPPSVTGNATDRSTLAIDSLGRLHLAWTEREPAGTHLQVFYSGFAGGAWTPAVQLSHSPGYAGFPSIAVDSQDRVHIVWYGFDGSFYQIYYRRLESSGWTAERALTNEAVDATNPAIALGPLGAVHIAWFRLQRSGTNTEVAYLRLEGDAIAETRALSDPAVQATDPSLLVNASGGVHVAWSGLVNGTDRLQHIRGPAPWSTVETFTPATVGARHPSLALDAAGRVHAIWEGSDGRVYHQAQDASAWSTPEVLANIGTNTYPSTRWSQDHNPLCGPTAKIDIVWTHEDAGVRNLSYAAIADPSPSPCPVALPEIPWGPIGLGATLAVLAVGLAVFLFRRRRRPSIPQE